MNILILIALCGLVSQSMATSSPVIKSDALTKSFNTAKPYVELIPTFYAVAGLRLLGASDIAPEVCALAKAKVNKANVESIYQALSLASFDPKCTLPVADFKATIAASASSKSVADLYFYTMIAGLEKTKIDSKALAKAVTDALKADSSIMNQAYSLHIASVLGEGQEKSFVSSIEDILEQADEVDGQFMQYEGGVGTTSFVLEGIFLLSEKANVLSAKLTQDRLTKFANYLTAKRFPANVRSAYYLTRAALKLSNNKFLVPMVLNRLSPVSVSAASPSLVISLTNIMGGKLTQKLGVEALSAKSVKNTLFAETKTFTAKSNDGTTFELKLIDSSKKLVADFYKVKINVTPKSSQFFLLKSEVDVKATAQVTITDFQIGTADRDQSNPKLTKLEENAKLSTRLDGDSQMKVYIRFAVKDKTTSAPIEAHQVFVRFTDAKTAREIVFLGQASSTNLYNADIDMLSNAKNFRHSSGVYTIELVVSDPLIENSISWKVGDIKLNFGGDSDHSELSSSDKAALYAKKPEIKHLFREAEAMPPKTVSTVFAVLCAAPLVLLLILWVSIGFNFSKFQLSLSAIVFHSALAAIFGLFWCYWTQLNMFQTVRYLAIIAMITLFAGNKLLKNLAANK